MNTVYVLEAGNRTTKFSAPVLNGDEDPAGDELYEYTRKLRSAIARLTGDSKVMGGVLAGAASLVCGYHGVADKFSGGMHPNGQFFVKKLK